MAISTYQEYRSLSYAPELKPGDILIKKVFPETAKGLVEKGITKGQKLFQKDEIVKVSNGRFQRSETFKFQMQGSNTSEHAAIVISNDMLAEAIENGVITASIWARMGEKYLVYRCNQEDVRAASTKIAIGLSDAYTNAITGENGRVTTGGDYSIGGALASNLYKKTGFTQDQMGNAVTTISRTLGNSNIKKLQKTLKPLPTNLPTNEYLQHIIDYVYGLRQDRPNMFCSEFAMACYEAGSVASRGKTAFGTDPRTMSPMRMEDVMNSHRDMVTFIGRLDSENNPLFHGVETALREYTDGLGMFRRQSEQSKKAVVTLKELLVIGNMEYLYAAVVAIMNVRPAQELGLVYTIPADNQISPTSTLYRILLANLKGLVIV